MRIRFPHLAMVLGALLTSASLASAQQIYNPIAASPYSRPYLSPYLNLNTSGTAANTFYRGVLEETALRNQSLRLSGILDSTPTYDLFRSPAYQSVTGYQSAEDWVNQRIRETQAYANGTSGGILAGDAVLSPAEPADVHPLQPRNGPAAEVSTIASYQLRHVARLAVSRETAQATINYARRNHLRMKRVPRLRQA